jgi:LysM repeat protein
MVMVLAGTGIVGAANTTRILQTGQQTTVPIAQGLAASDSPSRPEPVDIGLVGGLPYLMLPREITRLEPFAQATSPGSTAPPNIASTEESTGACPPSDGWTALYTVASGDTLSEIAAEYDVTVAELQEANCIDDPNRISPDQTLRVPPLPVEDTPAGQTIFTPDRDTIPRGECTTLTWDVADASLVYYQGDPVAHSASQEVCPLTTTTYTLLVIYSDGGQTGFTASVTVTDPP